MRMYPRGYARRTPEIADPRTISEMPFQILLRHEYEDERETKHELFKGQKQDPSGDSSHATLVTPGQVLTLGEGKDQGFLRGHGTFIASASSPNTTALVATVAGEVERVNQLITVRPLKTRYIGEVGDIVVGRVVEVGKKLWKIDVNGHQHALLQLTSVNLPTGAQRRRTYEDQLEMRQILQEGDLISAEVQDIRQDGTIALHTRNLRYGKLENGQFVQVPSALVKRLKQHMVTLANGLELILGTNGYLWITVRTQDEEASNDTNVPQETRTEKLLESKKRHAETEFTKDQRLDIAVIHNRIVELSQQFLTILPERLLL